MDIIFVGEGSYCRVYRYKKNNSVVLKVGENSIVKDDYDKIKMLPKRDFYIDPDFIFLMKCSDEENEYFLRFDPIIKTNLEKDGFNYKLIMPFLKGLTLEDYISKFKSREFLYSDSRVYIKLDEWKNLLISLFQLKNKIKRMNDIDRIFHNDLNASNIIYDYIDCKMSIIDFNTLTFELPFEYGSSDHDSIIDIIKFCIYELSVSPEIFNFIKIKRLNVDDIIKDSNNISYMIFL